MKLSSQKKGYLEYQKAHAEQLEQSELILMMFSGGINFLDKALNLAETDKVEMGKYVSKAKNVLLELMSSLNIEDSGEIGNILFKVYRTLFNKLNSAYILDDFKKIGEVRDSLAELESAWKKVFNSKVYEDFKKNYECSRIGNSP